MPTTPARAPRKAAEDRRREIADAALRVVAAEGLGRFTTLAIAREVGLSDAALFRHFPTKEAMVDAAIDRVEELLFEGFPPQGDDPLDRLGAFFARRVAVIRERPGISRLVATDELARAGSARGVERVRQFRARSVAFVRACLAEASRARRLAPGLGVEEASVVVVGALLALAHAPLDAHAAGAAALAPRVWAALETFLRGPSVRSRSAGRTRPRRPGRQERRGNGS